MTRRGQLALMIATGLTGIPSPASSADFFTVVDQLVAVDPQLKAEGNLALASDERDQWSRLRYLPQINGAADQTSDEHTVGLAYAPNIHGRSATLSATLNLFRSGADAAEIAARRSSAQAGRAARDNSRLETEHLAAALLVDLIAAQARVRALDIMTQAARATSLSADQLFSASRLSRREQQRLKASELSLATRLAAFSDAEKIAAARLKARLGQADVALVWPFAALFGGGTKLATALRRLDEAHALAGHPKYIQAHAEAEHAEREIAVTRAKLGPTLDAALSYKRQQIYDYHYFDNERTASLTLTVPLVTPEAPRAETRALEYEHLAASDRAATAQLQLEESRAAAKEALIGEASHIGAQMESVRAFKEVLADSRRLFALGQVSSVDLAVDEQAVFEADLALIDRWFSAHMSVMDYCSSLGAPLRVCVEAIGSSL